MHLKSLIDRIFRPSWGTPVDGWVAIPYIVSAVAAAGSAVEAKQASNQQAEAAQSAANYNAAVDKANAQQLAYDAQANIQKQRQQDEAYDSNQRAALAASGVLADTGSPMALQATTAGRQEQDIQQYWTSTQEKESTLYSSAEEGIAEGDYEAEGYHLEGAAEIFQGIGGVATAWGGAVKAEGWGTPAPGTGTPVSSVDLSQAPSNNDPWVS